MVQILVASAHAHRGQRPGLEDGDHFAPYERVGDRAGQRSEIATGFVGAEVHDPRPGGGGLAACRHGPRAEGAWVPRAGGGTEATIASTQPVAAVGIAVDLDVGAVEREVAGDRGEHGVGGAGEDDAAGHGVVEVVQLDPAFAGCEDVALPGHR